MFGKQLIFFNNYFISSMISKDKLIVLVLWLIQAASVSILQLPPKSLDNIITKKLFKDLFQDTFKLQLPDALKYYPIYKKVYLYTSSFIFLKKTTAKTVKRCG